jgi:hypothetical protein
MNRFIDGESRMPHSLYHAVSWRPFTVTWRPSAVFGTIALIIIILAVLLITAPLRAQFFQVPCDAFQKQGVGIWIATRQITVMGENGDFTLLPGQMASSDVVFRLEAQCVWPRGPQE